MTTSKLIARLFKRHNKKYTTVSEPTAITSSTEFPFGALPPTPQQLAADLRPNLQTASLFCSLPAELRNKIYEYATYPSLSSIAIFKTPEPVLSPNIFHICRQIRGEAISHLCSSKAISLSGLRTANTFFELARDEMPSLRHITIRSVSEWYLAGDEAEVERREFLDFVELATGLKSLTFVVGEGSLGLQVEALLSDAHSVGVRFLDAVRDVVDGGVSGIQKERLARETHITSLGSDGSMQMGSLGQAWEGRQAKAVFRLCKIIDLEGGLKTVTLPT